jgi:hypothetical protein
MTTMATEKQDASATVASLTARLTDAQERLAATGPEHARPAPGAPRCLRGREGHRTARRPAGASRP